MIKKAKRVAVGVFVFVMIMTNTAYAAGYLTYHHSDDTDTDDYCLSVYDASIGLSEIQACYGDDARIQALIIERANPVIRVRDNTILAEDWRQLTVEQLKFDFSQFIPVPNAAGYPVTVIAPAINLEFDSKISFTVFVEDDIPLPPPRQYATIEFIGANIQAMSIDITDGASLTLSDIETPVREGYAFAGWYLDDAFTAPFLVPENTDYMKQQITGDVVLYASWNEILVPSPSPSPSPSPKSDERVELQNEPSPEPNTYQEPEDEATQPPKSENAAVKQPSENTNNDVQQSETVNEQTPIDEEAPAQENDIPMYAYVLITVLSGSLVYFGLGIVSDIRVLKWYAEKKNAREVS